MGIVTECQKYVSWCKKYGLKPSNYNILQLFHLKDDMGFIFVEYQVAKENGALTDQEIAAVEGKEVGSTIEPEEEQIQIDTKVGTFFLIDAQDDVTAYEVLDSNKNFLGNVYTQDKKRFVRRLKAIEHISDICDLGVCDWMMYAKSKEELLEVLNNYIQEENQKYDDDSDLFTMDDLEYGKCEFYNIVGNNHFIVDFQ